MSDAELRSEISGLIRASLASERAAVNAGLLSVAGQIAAMRHALDLLAGARWPNPAASLEEGAPPPETK